MPKQDIMNAYLHALEKASYQDVIKLFSPDAVVYSPLYGK